MLNAPLPIPVGIDKGVAGLHPALAIELKAVVAGIDGDVAVALDHPLINATGGVFAQEALEVVLDPGGGGAGLIREGGQEQGIGLVEGADLGWIPGGQGLVPAVEQGCDLGVREGVAGRS